jgi:hypothetical protein
MSQRTCQICGEASNRFVNFGGLDEGWRLSICPPCLRPLVASMLEEATATEVQGLVANAQRYEHNRLAEKENR